MRQICLIFWLNEVKGIEIINVTDSEQTNGFESIQQE